MANVSPAFMIVAAFLVCSAAGAMFFRNAVHCALSVAVTFISLAALYLQLEAQFIGFAQILVYVGAVAILIVFAILLTRSGGGPSGGGLGVHGGWSGIVVAAVTFATLWVAILSSSLASRPTPEAPSLTVRQIGGKLLDQYVVPLEVVALLLTAAMIGAALIAMQDRNRSNGGES